MKYVAQGSFSSTSYERENSITVPLPHFPIRSNPSGHMPTFFPSCEGFCCLSTFKKQPSEDLFYSQISVMCKCSTSLRGNQWFPLRITPTQTVASEAIIILLRSFASPYMRRRQHKVRAKELISHMEDRARPEVKRLLLFID